MKMTWHPQIQTRYYVKVIFRKQQVAFAVKICLWKKMIDLEDQAEKNLPANRITRQRHRSYKRKK